jgi:hypothetical protein
VEAQPEYPAEIPTWDLQMAKFLRMKYQQDQDVPEIAVQKIL